MCAIIASGDGRQMVCVSVRETESSNTCILLAGCILHDSLIMYPATCSSMRVLELQGLHVHHTCTYHVFDLTACYHGYKARMHSAPDYNRNPVVDRVPVLRASSPCNMLNYQARRLLYCTNQVPCNVGRES